MKRRRGKASFTNNRLWREASLELLVQRTECEWN